MIGPSGDLLSIDISDLQQGLEDLARELRKPVGEVLRERSGFFARYLAESTFPIDGTQGPTPDGGSTKARDVGRSAVRRDIGRVYVPMNALVNEIKRMLGARIARAFVKLAKTNPAEAERLLRSANFRGSSLSLQPWDDGALHRRSRNSRGGINKGNKPVIVLDPPALKKYIRGREAKVGFAKGGWVTAGTQITTRGLGQVSKWIKGQGAPGTGTDRTDRDTDPYIALRNDVRYIARAFDDRQYARVEKSFERSLGIAIAKELEALIKKRNARTAARAGRR